MPVNIYLNNQQEIYSYYIATYLFTKLIIKSEFPPKYHMNIQICDKFYSFDKNGFKVYSMRNKECK